MVVNEGTARPELAGFGPAARQAFALAEKEARDLGHGRVGSEHLLVGLLANERGAAAGLLRDAGATLAAVRHKVAETPADDAAGHGEPLPLTSRANRALVRAVRFSHQRQAEEVGSAHLMLGVLDVEGTAVLILRRLGVDVDGIPALVTDQTTDANVDARPADPNGRTGGAAAVSSDLATATCPACAVQLALVYTIVPARGPGGDRDVALFRCAACGHVIGVSAARQPGSGPSGAVG